jgi:hypothetical protein
VDAERPSGFLKHFGNGLDESVARPVDQADVWCKYNYRERHSSQRNCFTLPFLFHSSPRFTKFHEGSTAVLRSRNAVLPHVVEDVCCLGARNVDDPADFAVMVPVAED